MKKTLFGAGILLTVALALSSCRKEPFELGTAVNDSFHVENGDYLIPVLVRGNTASGKILLYIQGGPGYASLDFAHIDYPEWKNTLEKDFAVAYYDQRGMGNWQGQYSQGDNVSATWVDDLSAVTDFLSTAYDADIVMLGHSFGGGLMYEYMIAKGDAATPVAFIAVDAPVTTDSEQDTLRWKFRREFLWNTAQLELSRGRRVEQWEEVVDWLNAHPVIELLPGDNEYELMNQWNEYVEDLVYIDYPEKLPTVGQYAKVAFASRYNPISYLSGRYRGEIASRILLEEMVVPLTSQLGEITQDLLIVGGRFDDICPPEEELYVFDQVSSANKEIHIIDHAGHTCYTDQPEAFYEIIKTYLNQ
ncbi:MAG: alpha/beta hydrolase [Flavobacteriales bacterium]